VHTNNSQNIKMEKLSFTFRFYLWYIKPDLAFKIRKSISTKQKTQNERHNFVARQQLDTRSELPKLI